MRASVAVAAAAVALVVAGTTAAVVTQALPDDEPPPAPTPVALPAAARTPLLPSPAAAAPLSAAGVAAALERATAAPALGPRVAVHAVDVATGDVLADRNGSATVTPASTVKILTAAAALTRLAPDQRLVTRVVAGATPGEVVIIGGGDPTLSGPQATAAYPRSPRLADLAAAVKARGTPVTRVVVDGTLYSGPVLARGWKPSYITEGAIAPVTALSMDSGRVRPGKRPRVAEPDLVAGRAFAQLLGAPAVPVVRGVAAEGAAELARVESAPVPTLVEAMLERSDNDIAEALGRHLAIAGGVPASFDGAGAAVGRAVAELGVDTAAVELADTSGLSRADRVQPQALTRVLALAAGGDQERLRMIASGLPVAGFTGTLEERYRKGVAILAAGEVRAKTGTLLGVSALAGLTRTESGRLVAFAIVADQVPMAGTRRAEAALDAVAATLAGCGCP